MPAGQAAPLGSRDVSEAGPPRPVRKNDSFAPPHATMMATADTALGAGDGELDGFRKLAFRAGLAMLFIRVTALPELLVALIHANTYLLYVVGPPSIFGAILTGGLQRTFKHRAAWMWLGFLVCMLLSIPTSTWPGASVQSVKLYGFISFPLIFVVGGLSSKRDDVRTIFTTIGVSGIFLIVAASFMAKPDMEGRLSMTDSSTTIGNSNDLASLLILLLPFVMYVATDKRRLAILRWPLIIPIALAFKMILSTASRGAIVAILAGIVFVVFRGSGRHKLVVVFAMGGLVAAAPFVVNANSLERLATLMGGAVEANSVGEEARESKEERRYVLEQSLIASLKHPVLGVGMGQFSNYVGLGGKAEGRYGAALHWTETHNAFTQVSSECGTPALIFFVMGIVLSLGSVNRAYGRARREGFPEIANMCFFYMVSMLPYVVSIVFLANAYRLYLPAMIGLAVALSSVAQREMNCGRVAAPPGFGGIGPGMAGRYRPDRLA
jgi:hypothetical protein